MVFAFVCDNVALDFAATVGHRRSVSVELLSAPDDVSRWLAEGGVVDHRIELSRLDYELALQLREAIYRLATDCIDGTPHTSQDIDLLNRMSAIGPVRPVLRADGSITRAGDAAAALSTVAGSAVELIGGEQRRSIRECGDPECTRLYVDSSSRGTRRWCSMQQCGNRAKAAGFRSRRAAPVTQDQS